MVSGIEQFQQVERAFSRQAAGYDACEAHHPTLRWMRDRVRGHVLNYLKSGDHILEINAGTGTDAIFFARKGWHVTATDISTGMLLKMESKIHRAGLTEKISPKKRSYYHLNTLYGQKFDYLFSNFGGLNCSPNLKPVFRQFPKLLSPGAFVTLIMMPKICPWELALFLKGYWSTAVRRLHRKGVEAHIEGEYFRTYYYSPRSVLRALGGSFRLIRLEGLGTLTPPPFMDNFPRKWPAAFHLLTKTDEKICSFFPFNRWADHFILTAQFKPDRKKRFN